MAGGAFPWSIFVNQYLPCTLLLPVVVAQRALHGSVRSGKRVGGIRIVVKFGGLPFQDLMALATT
jgi:hypothetical protein